MEPIKASNDPCMVKAWISFACNILSSVNVKKEDYKERVLWMQSPLCASILEVFNIGKEEYRRKILPEEYASGYPGVQLEFDFSR